MRTKTTTAFLAVMICVGVQQNARAANVIGRWKGRMEFVAPPGFAVDSSLQEYRKAVGQKVALLNLRKDKTFLLEVKQRPGMSVENERVKLNPGNLSGSWSLKGDRLNLSMTKRNGKKINGMSFTFLVQRRGTLLVQVVTSGMKTTFVR